MGVAHIMYVYEDGIKQPPKDVSDVAAFQQEIGAAVLKVCLDASYANTPDGLLRLRSHGLRSHSNAVNWVDEVLSTQTRLFIWDQNCLQTLSEASDEELAAAKRLIEREMAGRPR
jgi:hypothetical protein